MLLLLAHPNSLNLYLFNSTIDYDEFKNLENVTSNDIDFFFNNNSMVNIS